MFRDEVDLGDTLLVRLASAARRASIEEQIDRLIDERRVVTKASGIVEGHEVHVAQA